MDPQENALKAGLTPQEANWGAEPREELPHMFPFKTSLNASTLFPFKLDIKEQIRIAAETGYEGIEIWVRDLEAYLAKGHSLQSLKRYVSDTGISLVNAITFFKWADANDAVREQGFVQVKHEMEMLTELGCAAVAAPPFGSMEGVTLDEMAVHYARLVTLGRNIGIEPYLEFWGRAKQLSKLNEAAYVLMESGVPDAKLLLDPFHMYTGGSRMEGLAYLNGNRIGIVHVNDYPASPWQAEIADREWDRAQAGILYIDIRRTIDGGNHGSLQSPACAVHR